MISSHQAVRHYFDWFGLDDFATFYIECNLVRLGQFSQSSNDAYRDQINMFFIVSHIVRNKVDEHT